MKPKQKMLVAVTLVAVIVLVQACRKFDFFSKESKKTEFTVAEAKEWYYGVFKKSANFKKIDYSSAFAPDPNYFTGSQSVKNEGNSFFKKYPYWNKAVSYNLGTMQVVEMPIAYEARVLVLPGMQNIAVPDRKKIAEASLQKVLFIKKADQTVSVRIVTLIPSLDYLKSKEYDISDNTMHKPDEDFDGIVVIRNWQEKVINVMEVKDAKYKRKIKLIKSGTQPADFTSTNNSSEQSSSDECGWVLTVKIIKYCLATTGSSGDQPPANPDCPSGEWSEYREEEWEFVPCEPTETDPFQDCIKMGNSEEQCNCQIYGLGCGDDDPPPPDEEDCTNSMNSLKGNPVSTIIGIETESSAPETRQKKYTWRFHESLGWHFFSIERGVHKKENNEWKWDSFTHQSYDRSGLVIGGSITMTSFTATPHMGIYNAIMELDYAFKGELACKGSPISETFPFTAAKNFNVND